MFVPTILKTVYRLFLVQRGIMKFGGIEVDIDVRGFA